MRYAFFSFIPALLFLIFLRGGVSRAGNPVLTLVLDEADNCRAFCDVLRENKIRFMSAANQKAYLNDFSALLELPLDEYFKKVDVIDPRNDGYAQKLYAVFISRGEQRIYIKNSSRKRVAEVLQGMPYKDMRQNGGEAAFYVFLSVFFLLVFAGAFFLYRARGAFYVKDYVKGVQSKARGHKPFVAVPILAKSPVLAKSKWQAKRLVLPKGISPALYLPVSCVFAALLLACVFFFAGGTDIKSSDENESMPFSTTLLPTAEEWKEHYRFQSNFSYKSLNSDDAEFLRYKTDNDGLISAAGIVAPPATTPPPYPLESLKSFLP